MYPRRLWPALLLLLAAWPALAAEQAIVSPAFGPSERAAADGVSLSGPASLAVGVEGTWRLSGTPAVDLTKPLQDQLAWALGPEKMFVYAMPPGKAAQPLDVRLELVIAASGITLQPVIRYAPIVAGEHRVVVDWNTGQNQLVEALFTTGPKPPDPPDPPDPPPPVGKWQVLLIHESDDLDNLPTGQQNLLSGRVFRDALTAKGHRLLGVFDADAMATGTQQCRNGTCITVRMAPAVWKPWLAAVTGDPMPRVCIAPIDGGDIRDFPLPADEAAFWKLLEAQR